MASETTQGQASHRSSAKQVPMLQLDELRPLHQNMRRDGIDRAAFRYRNNQARVEVVFITDENPYVLLIAVRSGSLFAFELPVARGYKVPMLFNEHLSPLMDALGVTPNPTNPFSTKRFLADLARHIPSRITDRNLPTEALALRKPAAGVEESAKKYFEGWTAHSDGRHVTARNLAKTASILGRSIAERCEKSNVSSRWTDKAEDQRRVTSPPGPRGHRPS